MKKKIRKALVYTIAFFYVLGRRLSDRSKRQLTCALCVALLVCAVFPCFYQANIIGIEQTVVLEKMSTVTNSGADASVMMTNSKLVKEDSSESKDSNKNRVVKNKTESTKEGSKNQVKAESEKMSLIEALYADYGVQPSELKLAEVYQYPVEEGQKADFNYNRKQKAGDYILREVYEVEPEDGGQSVSENSAEDEKAKERDEEDAVDPGVEVVEEESVEEPEKTPAELEEAGTVSENSVSGNSVSANTVKESEPAVEAVVQEPEERIFDAGCYSFNGSLNKAGTYYLSNILLKPVGVDGYNLVRIGTKGKFYRSVLLTEEGTDIRVPLYFSDGKKISNEVTFSYSKDTVSPLLSVETDAATVLETEKQKIYCINEDSVKLSLSDEQPGSGIMQARYDFGDRSKFILSSFKDAAMVFGADFYGRVKVFCEDRAGNASDTQSILCLYEDNAPEITIEETERYTAPYSMWAYIEEPGEIVSGIKGISCKINGETIEEVDLQVTEATTLYPGVAVPTKGWYPILLDEVGEYAIELTVTDNAGNETTVKREVEVTEAELVSVLMPDRFTIHIDPQQLKEREQIYSDEIELINNSDFDIRVKVERIVLTVNSGVSDMGVVKDCQMYLVAPDTGEKILISAGESKDVYSYKLPIGDSTDAKNLYFCGETTEGSDEMWEDSDVSIHLSLAFEKWEEEEK